MRIMTSNIWGDYFGNETSTRILPMLTVYTRYTPDVLGLQEITPGWYQSGLFEKLGNDYTPVEAHAGNYVPLVYKTERFEELEAGFELYTETPDVSKGITWAVLKDKCSGQFAGFCNTHFWWKTGEEHDRIRVKNAKQLIKRMRKIREDHACPVFAFGDINSRYASPAVDVLREAGITSLYHAAEERTEVSSYHGDPVRGEDGLYHGVRTTDPFPFSIDHIFSFENNARILRYCVVEDAESTDATDHSPVCADIRL